MMTETIDNLMRGRKVRGHGLSVRVRERIANQAYDTFCDTIASLADAGLTLKEEGEIARVAEIRHMRRMIARELFATA